MKHAIKSVVLGISLLLANGSIAYTQPQSDWRFVAGALYRASGSETVDSQTKYIVQVDRASMRRSKTGVTYWLRITNVPEGGELSGKPSRGPSLYEDNCLLNKLRVVQGPIIWGWGSDGYVPVKRPTDWQYIEPDSLAQITHRYVCKR